MLQAAVFFVESISPKDLRHIYDNHKDNHSRPKLKVVLVPGHEPDSGGAVYKDYLERDIVVDIANELADLLNEQGIDVIVTRNKQAWLSELSYYFENNEADIQAFMADQIAQMQKQIERGRIDPLEDDDVHHNRAKPTAALHLYGLNKWASEEDVGITLHLHINDYPGSRNEEEYNGFAVYVPESYYSNARASREIGYALANRLNAYHATSSMPKEQQGVIEDRELIAVGSNNSTDAASVLIEYGYIYENQFRNAATRAVAAKDYAYETCLGIMDFLKDRVESELGTNVLPYIRSEEPKEGKTTPGTYLLQMDLHARGLYPPRGRTFNDCPVSGYFGACTKAALEAHP